MVSMSEHYDRAKRFARSTTGKWLQILLALVVLVGVFWAGWDQFLQPREKFVVAFHTGPTTDPSEMEKLYGAILAELSEGLGMEVEFVLSSDYATAIEALRNGTADMVRLGPFSYIVAHDECGAIPLVREIMNGKPYYLGQIIAQPGIFDEPYNLADIAGHSVAFVEPTSTSGYLVSLAMMREAGITLDDLSEYYFAGSHPSAIEAVLNGAADVAATCDRRVNVALGEGILVEGENYVTLAFSPPLTLNPWCVRGDMDAEMQERITEIFLDMSDETIQASEPEGFVVAVDADYDFTRKVAEEMP